MTYVCCVCVSTTTSSVQVVIQTTTTADARQLRDWMAYHMSLGVAYFYIVCDGDDAAPNRVERLLGACARKVGPYTRFLATGVYNKPLLAPVAEFLPRAYARVVPRDLALRDRQAQSRTWREGWLRPFFHQPCNWDLFVKQSLNMEVGIQLAQADGMDWIIHLDTDELLYPGPEFNHSLQVQSPAHAPDLYRPPVCVHSSFTHRTPSTHSTPLLSAHPGGRCASGQGPTNAWTGSSLFPSSQALLARSPPDVLYIEFANYEALPETVDVRDPFQGASSSSSCLLPAACCLPSRDRTGPGKGCIESVDRPSETRMHWVLAPSRRAAALASSLCRDHPVQAEPPASQCLGLSGPPEGRGQGKQRLCTGLRERQVCRARQASHKPRALLPFTPPFRAPPL